MSFVFLYNICVHDYIHVILLNIYVLRDIDSQYIRIDFWEHRIMTVMHLIDK